MLHGALGGALALAPLVLPLLAASRLRGGLAGENPVRAAILRALSTGRCASPSELARSAGVSRKTVSYHLPILERAGMVARRAGPRALWVMAGRAPPQAPALRALEHPSRRALWEAARVSPGSTVAQLARGLGLKGSTAYFHARVLWRHGLLAPAGSGGVRAAAPVPQPAPEPAPPADAWPPEAQESPAHGAPLRA